MLLWDGAPDFRFSREAAAALRLLPPVKRRPEKMGPTKNSTPMSCKPVIPAATCEHGNHSSQDIEGADLDGRSTEESRRKGGGVEMGGPTFGLPDPSWAD